MDKATVKLLLESYRPQNAGDPIFAEALREVAADPELGRWFEEMQRLDNVLSAKLDEMPVPEDIQSHILLGYQVAAKTATPPGRRGRLVVGAIAAMLALVASLWYFLPPRERQASPLELQAISYTDRMPPLQFVCFNAAAVAEWVNKQPGSQKMGFKLPKPPESLSMAMIGSSVIEWNGKPVVMICLQNGERMAMLYILNADDAPDLKEGVGEPAQKADWVVRTTKSQALVKMLTTKGRPSDLDFKMPF